MNFRKNRSQKISKWSRIKGELEEDLEDAETYDQEAGADLRWSIVMLGRAILGLRASKEK